MSRAEPWSSEHLIYAADIGRGFAESRRVSNWLYANAEPTVTWRRAQSVPRALMLRTLPWVLPRTGDRLPHDELISILGSGGIERVYAAHDWRLRRDVAVKVLTPEAAAKPEMRLRFEREARAMAGATTCGLVRSPGGKWYHSGA